MAERKILEEINEIFEIIFYFVCSNKELIFYFTFLIVFMMLVVKNKINFFIKATIRLIKLYNI